MVGATLEIGVLCSVFHLHARVHEGAGSVVMVLAGADFGLDA